VEELAETGAPVDVMAKGGGAVAPKRLPGVGAGVLPNAVEGAAADAPNKPPGAAGVEADEDPNKLLVDGAGAPNKPPPVAGAGVVEPNEKPPPAPGAGAGADPNEKPPAPGAGAGVEPNEKPPPAGAGVPGAADPPKTVVLPHVTVIFG